MKVNNIYIYWERSQAIPFLYKNIKNVKKIKCLFFSWSLLSDSVKDHLIPETQNWWGRTRASIKEEWKQMITFDFKVDPFSNESCLASNVHIDSSSHWLFNFAGISVLYYIKPINNLKRFSSWILFCVILNVILRNVGVFYFSFAIDYYSGSVPLPMVCDGGSLGNFSGIIMFQSIFLDTCPVPPKS